MGSLAEGGLSPLWFSGLVRSYDPCLDPLDEAADAVLDSVIPSVLLACPDVDS